MKAIQGWEKNHPRGSEGTVHKISGQDQEDFMLTSARVENIVIHKA